MNSIRIPAAICLVFAVGCSGAARGASPVEAEGPGLAIRVATYNVLTSSDPNRILKNLQLLDADIVCLQEVRNDATHLKRFVDQLKMTAAYAAYGPRSGAGMAILARGTIKPGKVLNMAGERDYGFSADVTIKGETVRVLCIHLKSLPRPLIRGAMESMGARTRQAKDVVELAEASPHPVIVAGDTNSLGFFPSYVALARSLTDCCAACGTTTQPSIFVNRAGYRIDHVFVRGPWAIDAARVRELDGSDHRPVVAELRLLGPTTRPAGLEGPQEPSR